MSIARACRGRRSIARRRGARAKKIATPGVDTIAALADFLRARGDAVAPERNVKTMIVEGDSGMAAILLRGATD